MDSALHQILQTAPSPRIATLRWLAAAHRRFPSVQAYTAWVLAQPPEAQPAMVLLRHAVQWPGGDLDAVAEPLLLHQVANDEVLRAVLAWRRELRWRVTELLLFLRHLGRPRTRVAWRQGVEGAYQVMVATQAAVGLVQEHLEICPVLWRATAAGLRGCLTVAEVALEFYAGITGQQLALATLRQQGVQQAPALLASWQQQAEALGEMETKG